MAATAHLHEPVGDHGTTVECDSIELRGSVAWLEPAATDGRVVVPMDNVTGVAGPSIEQSVDQMPTKGGQYTQVLTLVE